MRVGHFLRSVSLALAAGASCGALPRTPVYLPDAVSEYRALAMDGDRAAQRIAGHLYLQHRDYAQALHWLRLAGAAGDTSAQMAVADLYRDRPEFRDAGEAAYWYRKASARSAEALWKLGQLYEEGEGVAANAELALTLYRRAAEQGSAAAQNSLGNLAMLSRDYGQALRWYRQSAAQNYAPAFLNLAGLYYEGLGVKRDYAAAYRWAQAAEQQHAQDAQAFLREIAQALAEAR